MVCQHSPSLSANYRNQSQTQGKNDLLKFQNPAFRFLWCHSRFSSQPLNHSNVFYKTFYRRGYLILTLLTFSNGLLFSLEDWPIHCRMCSRIPDLYSLDASNILSPRCNNQNHLQTWPNVPSRTDWSLVENHYKWFWVWLSRGELLL